ncbi:MAG TPA: lysophospholipid acyltransferase family protein [Anaerolineae bacterium]|nr:lysophospholipid acyltransferase family protein [Anaerolineae bacterium]
MTQRMEEASKVGGRADWRDNLTWYTHETIFARLIKFGGELIFSPLAQVELVSFERIPTTGACILAVNHISNWDVVYMGLCSPRHPHFMAKVELYINPVFGAAIRWYGSFPVHRGENDAWALRQAGRVLEAGQLLCMFPEGTRSKGKAQLRRGKVGVVRLALDYHAPVVPIAISGTHDFRFRGWKGNKIRIEAGQPLDFVALNGSSTYDHDTLRELTSVLMRQIAAMLPPANRGIYA